MKRNDELKLRVLSEINDEIIDKNSTTRAKLLRKPKMNRKKLVAIYAMAACLFLIGGSLLAIIPALIKQVPVYQGMTVSSDASASTLQGYEGEAQYVFVSTHGVFSKDKDKDKNKDKELEEAVKDSLDVTGADQMYYAKPSEDIYITIHISNPDNFEILSFTLNGKKYSSYMFEEGSDMERIVIKVNVGEASGISEYTIDAIKYVDGTEIKDVRMDGDRTVKVGVYTENQPAASIGKENISYDSVSFEVTVSDPEKLISLCGGELLAVLYDGEKIVDSLAIEVGKKTTVTFENLKPNATYRYAVVATYDALDGKGFGLHILARKEFTASSVLSFADLQVMQGEVSFTLRWSELVETKELLSLAIYQNDTLIRELPLDATEASGLYSNTSYTLVAEYLRDGISERISVDFKTQAKTVPEVQVAEEDISSKGFQFLFADPDAVGSVTKIELLRDGAVVKTLTNLSARSFDGLTENTVYQLRVGFAFNLNDGKGSVSKEATHTVVTLPKPIEITQVSVFGASVVNAGDSVFLRLQFSNPGQVELKGIEIGGSTVQLLKSGSYYECIYKPTSQGGKEEIKVTGISFVNAANQTVTQKTDYVDDSLILVAGQVSVEDFYIDEYFHVSEDTLVATVVFKGSEPYEIESVICDIDGNDYYDQQIDPEFALTKVSDTVYTVKLPWKDHPSIVSVKILQIKLKGGTKQEIPQDAETGSNRVFYVCEDFGELAPSDFIPISTPEELQSMQRHGAYKLVNDIDLSGFNWEPFALRQVYLDGNGFAIKNLSMSVKEDCFQVGMFTDVSHCYFYNVTLENASVVVWGSAEYCGILAGSAVSTIFEKCSVEGNIRCGADAEVQYCGGYVGNHLPTYFHLEGIGCYYCTYDGSSIYSLFLDCVFKGTIEGSNLKKTCAFVRGSRYVLIGCTAYADFPLLIESKNSIVIDCKSYPYEP